MVGAVQCTTAEAFPGDAVTLVGASGTSETNTVFNAADDGPVPKAPTGTIMITLIAAANADPVSEASADRILFVSRGSFRALVWARVVVPWCDGLVRRSVVVGFGSDCSEVPAFRAWAGHAGCESRSLIVLPDLLSCVGDELSVDAVADASLQRA
jgi:hypothetical protein